MTSGDQGFDDDDLPSPSEESGLWLCHAALILMTVGFVICLTVLLMR